MMRSKESMSSLIVLELWCGMMLGEVQNEYRKRHALVAKDLRNL